MKSVNEMREESKKEKLTREIIILQIYNKKQFELDKELKKELRN